MRFDTRHLLAMGLLLCPMVSNAQSEFSVGADGASVLHEFGTIGSVVLLAEDRLAVADLSRHRIVLVSPRSRTVRHFGRWGKGPREFESVAAVVATSPNEIVVLDAGARRVTVLRVRGDSLEFVRSFQTEVSGHRACAIGARIFVQGIPLRGPVDEYRLREAELEHVATLGVAAVSDAADEHPMIRSFNLVGEIGCSSDSRALIAWAPVQRGRVQVVDRVGSTVTTSLRDFPEQVYRPIPNGIRHEMPEGNVVHQNRSLVWAGTWIVGSLSGSPDTRLSGQSFVRVVSPTGSSTPRPVQFLPVASDGRRLVCVSGIVDDPTIHVGSVSSLEWRRACGVD